MIMFAICNKYKPSINIISRILILEQRFLDAGGFGNIISVTGLEDGEGLFSVTERLCSNEDSSISGRGGGGAGARTVISKAALVLT